MTDVFEEVEGQLRANRYRELGRRALPFAVVLAAVLLVGALAVWGWTAWQDRRTEQASLAYAAAIESLQQGNRTAAAAKLEQARAGGSRAYASLAGMALAAMRLSDGKQPEAVTLLDEAAKRAPSPMLGDAAALKAAWLVMDTAPYQATADRLTPLTEEGRPYRPLAREALAMAKLQAGRAAEARTELSVLSISTESTDSIRDRARAAIELIDSGGAKSLPQVVKTPLTTPLTGSPAAPVPANPAPAAAPVAPAR